MNRRWHGDQKVGWLGDKMKGRAKGSQALEQGASDPHRGD
jgi:hypothetical protein